MPKSASIATLAIAVLAFGGGWVRYSAERDPAAALQRRGPAHRWLGPSPDRIAELAESALKAASGQLASRELSGAERLRNYRADLARAVDLTAIELQGDAGRWEAWARLAAIRWELTPISDGSAHETFFRQVHEVAQRSRDRPRAQLRLGDLMLGLGDSKEAAFCFDRALSRRPDLSKLAVELLARRGESAERIQSRLPRSPAVLQALRSHYLDEGNEAGYLRVLASGFDAFPLAERMAILPAYGATSLSQGQPARLEQSLVSLGPLKNARNEAVRLEWLARSLSAQERHDEAREAVERACVAHPRPADCYESAGSVAAAGGRVEAALKSYEQATHWVARHTGDPTTLSRLQYRRGRIEERLQEFARAKRAYRRALELNPENRPARQRMARLEQSGENE